MGNEREAEIRERGRGCKVKSGFFFFVILKFGFLFVRRVGFWLNW